MASIRDLARSCARDEDCGFGHHPSQFGRPARSDAGQHNEAKSSSSGLILRFSTAPCSELSLGLPRTGNGVRPAVFLSCARPRSSGPGGCSLRVVQRGSAREDWSSAATSMRASGTPDLRNASGRNISWGFEEKSFESNSRSSTSVLFPRRYCANACR